MVIPATRTATETVLVIKHNAVNTSDNIQVDITGPLWPVRLSFLVSADSYDLADQDVKKICLRQSLFMTRCKDLQIGLKYYVWRYNVEDFGYAGASVYKARTI